MILAEIFTRSGSPQSNHEMVERATVGNSLIVGGIILFVAMLVVSAMLAPTIGTASATTGSPKTLIGLQGGGPGIHYHGSVALVNGKHVVWRKTRKNVSYFGVTKLKNGSVLAGFIANGYKKGCSPYKAPCTKTGFRIIDPTPKPHVVYEWHYPVRTETDSETHDVEPLPQGGFLLTDMEHERILIVKHGKITWEWNASTVYTNGPKDPTKHDWLHINDVDRISKGKYLVSVRNRNQLLVIKRQQHGGKVVQVINKANTSNGIGMGDPNLFKGQHNPQWLDPGALMVADSENNRVVEIHKNNTTDRWHVAWSINSANGVHFRWPRDADRLPNGNTLITDSLNQRIVEVNPAGKVVWSYKTKNVPYEADRLPYGNDDTYNASRHNSSRSNTSVSGVSGPEKIPILTPTLQILKSSYPLPYWLSETQVFFGYVSLLLVVIGGVVRWRS